MPDRTLIRKGGLTKKTACPELVQPLGHYYCRFCLAAREKGLQNLKEGRFTLESFLGGSIIVAVAAGEATAALEILWITSGASLLQTWISERSRRVREARRIGSLLGKW